LKSTLSTNFLLPMSPHVMTGAWSGGVLHGIGLNADGGGRSNSSRRVIGLGAAHRSRASHGRRREVWPVGLAVVQGSDGICVCGSVR